MPGSLFFGLLSYPKPTITIREEYWRSSWIALKFVEVFMPIGNSGTIDEKIDSELWYSQSLKAAVKLILEDPAFVRERETFSFKFIRAARLLKDNAPHVFQIREMGTNAKNSMDRWLWDLLD
jgi:hypothetical protein